MDGSVEQSELETPVDGWSLEKSEEMYQIRGWGEPYFRINDKGQRMLRRLPAIGVASARETPTTS